MADAGRRPDGPVPEPPQLGPVTNFRA